MRTQFKRDPFRTLQYDTVWPGTTSARNDPYLDIVGYYRKNQNGGAALGGYF